MTATSYFDGLGRPMQEVVRMGNPSNARDVVSVHAYDEMDRESYKYLGYGAADYASNRGKLRISPLTELSGAYNFNYQGEQPYSQNVYEKSPLEKVLKSMAPGSSWIGSNRGTTVDYDINANGNEDRILMYNIGYSGVDFNTGLFQDLPVSAGYYPNGTLTKVKTTDEDGKWVVEYTDQLGRKIAIQRFADYNGSAPSDWVRLYNITYYIYDDLGRIRFVISPEGYRQSMLAGGITTQAVANGLCYQYWYDNRGRQIAQRIPGKATEYFVYDSKDRVVAHQDGNLRAAGKWDFTIYDVMNRPILTGIYNSNSTQQQLATALMDATTYSAPNLLYYLKQASLYNNAPTSISNCELLAFSYYDDYSNTPGAAFDNSFTNKLTGQAPYASLPIAASHLRGLPTGAKIKVMDPTASVQWITSENFYDSKGRLIQQQSNNIKSGTDIITNQYDFAGTLVSSVQHHSNPEATPINGVDYTNQEVVKRYTKDYQCGVVTQLEQNINNVGWRSIYTIGFDDFNRLKNKNLSAADNYYDYNIRGMLTGINAAFIDVSAPSNKYFFETLSYDNGFKSKLYNGNIAGIQWKGAGSGANKRCYGYTYDEQSRLKHAEYNELVPNSTGGSWNKSLTDYTASNINYDYNGNILTMHQRGPGTLNGGPLTMVDMDKMSYAYAPATNQLQTVTESNTGVVSSGPDFKDGNTSGNDYQYDQNGNLTIDRNKAINSNILYSHLDKPIHIAVDGKGSIDYVYDALGNKLQKKVTPVSGNKITTDYIGGFVYEDNKLQYMIHEEGRCRPQLNSAASVPVFDYDYFLKDHLGNVRSVINAQTSGLGPILDYNAGMELSMANVECTLFRHLDDVRDNKPLSSGPTDTKAAQLDGTDPGKRIGVALMLKVMPGDRFDLSAETYYDAVGENNVATGDAVASSLLNTFFGGSTYSGVPVGELPDNMKIVDNLVNSPQFVEAYNTLTDANFDNSKPAAFLNYMVYDENFRLVSENSGALQVGNGGSQWNLISTNGQITIDRPGYITVFASSKAGSPVFFDKVDMTYYKGTVLEENHYYPFGLTLSTQTTNVNEKNSYKLTTKELQDNFDLNWYDFGARMQDEQIGRWLQVDPKAEKYHATSNFVYAGNNPIKFIDPNGQEIWIFAGKEKFRYDNVSDKIFNQDGTEYTKKLKGFLGKTVDALKSVNSTDAGKELLTRLSSSELIYDIHKTDKKNKENKFTASDLKKSIANFLRTDPVNATTLQALNQARINLDGGSGGVIYWNPGGTPIWTTAGIRYDQQTDLAHEMSHAFDASYGLLNDKLEQGIKKDEWQAVYRENLIRSQLNLPLRTNYLDQVDQAGTVIGPYPPYMLNANGEPIRPSWYNQ